jgi:hypothetical protein
VSIWIGYGVIFLVWLGLLWLWQWVSREMLSTPAAGVLMLGAFGLINLAFVAALIVWGAWN